MFARNGQYIINELEENTFDKQLPSSSVKITFKKERQKILDRMQQKYQLEFLKQKIHQKCKAQELSYLDQLQKQKQKFIQKKQLQEKNKKQYLLNFMKNKYQIQTTQNNLSQKSKIKTERIIRDSIDGINKKDSSNINKSRVKYQFSLEPSKEKQKQKIEEDEWIKKVRQGRKKLEAMLGKYYEPGPIKNDSDSQSSQSSS